MGLRVRKSVKICDGLRLNFGKTGASLTVGSGPFKKTFNTNGNVTKTVGLPGTGIYWTETERRGTRSNRRASTSQQARATTISPQSDYQISLAINDYFTQGNISDEMDAASICELAEPVVAPEESHKVTSGYSAPQSSTTVTTSINGLSAEDIKKIYIYEDAPVDWTELVAGATADDLLMDSITHGYCSQMASRILSGDVDVYLEVIERMRPVDDLALYSGDFEFGTDNPSYIEVEFVASPERVLTDGASDDLLEKFVSAVAVRVARDLFALLPVTKVLIHVELNGNTILSVIFNRKLCGINYRNNSAKKIVREFPGQASSNYQCLASVDRMRI